MNITMKDFLSQNVIGSLFGNLYGWDLDTKYPPYSIRTIRGPDKIVDRAFSFPPATIKGDVSGYVIEIACAGFAKNQLKIWIEDNKTLIVEAKSLNETDDKDNQYRGLAQRMFRKKFALAEGVKVTNAKFENGLLTINLSFEPPSPSAQEIMIE